ncbi:MAG: beta-galactosidase [Victivallales bacterium]
MPLATLLASVLLGAQAAAENLINMPEGIKVQASMAFGQGQGTMSVDKDVLKIEAKADTLGDYAENWKFKAAVFDYVLPEPVQLPPECAKLSLYINCDGPANKHVPAMFRVLVRDSRGGIWAVGTRLRSQYSGVPSTKGFERIESYTWDTSEGGRIDPWVMMSLTPDKFDEYDAPKLPLSFAGVRLVLPKLCSFSMEVKDPACDIRGVQPDPYWCISPELIYSKRFKPGSEGGGASRYGWGPYESGPFLKAGDLNLPAGNYAFSWEILDRNEWDVMASRAGTFKVVDASSSISFPLLANGTYRLRLYLRGESSVTGNEHILLYTVIRNSRGEALREAAMPPKPLSFKTDNPGSNVFEAGAPVKVSIACDPNSAKGKTISWVVESCDGRKLDEGKSDAGSMINLDLGALASKETTLWIKASLMDGDKVIDICRRVVGCKSAPEAVAAPVDPDPAGKLKPLMNTFRRTKGDWFEGMTSIATNADLTMKQMKTWLDEGKDTGYNIVELSAPWYDLEPIEGVYQFSYLDRLVDEAKKRGFHVVIRAHPVEYSMPGWVDRELQEDMDHRAHGIWYGAGTVSSPASALMREKYFKYLKTLATHYRQDPKVLGYTLSNVFYDHSLIDCPWTGQFVDYSDAMRRRYVADLRKKYNEDLQALCASHARNYHSWEDVEIPRVALSMDDKGRITPRPDKAMSDYEECKANALMSFRTESFKVLREGDPACVIGPYSDHAREFLESNFAENKIFVPQGSMEDQYPPLTRGYIVRYEPHAKVARTALTTDIGVTNLIFHKPGWNELYNYWFPNWKLAEVAPEIREAELRLKAWFAAIDKMEGAKESLEDPSKMPLVIHSLETLVYSWQHVHTSRIYDYVNPYYTRAAIEKVRYDRETSGALTPAEFAGRPYVYVPYCSDTFTGEKLRMMADYVENGGKLVLEPTSGFFQLSPLEANSLGRLLGLPESAPCKLKDEKQTGLEASCASGSILEGVKLAFRVKEYKPPIDNQPVAWLHCAIRNYLRPCKLASAVPQGAAVLATADGAPSAILVKKGKGEILFFCGGVVDWFASPGLALRIDNWGRGRPLSADAPNEPEILASPMERKGTLFVVGRRFVNHALISKLKQGNTPDECKTPKALSILFPQAKEGRYKVTELVTGKDLGVLDAEQLRTKGVPLDLRAGEGFLLEAAPAK